jgi:hypothetical protein
MQRLLRFITVVIVCAPSLRAAPPATHKPVTPSEEKSKFVFSLLPRSFQSNPALDLAGLTEMTPDGKKLPPPSAENPVYYSVHDAGFHSEGDSSGGALKVDPARIEASLKRSLEKACYLPTDAAHPATQILFLIWGSHNTISKNEDHSIPPNYWPNVLSRARLVGGEKFAADFQKALRDQFNSPMDLGIGNPLYRFTNRDDLTRELVEQVYDDCYYIVVSAYDAISLANGQRMLLWRTKITTSADGVSLLETLPALISSGANYFGRDLPVADIRIKRIDRKGEVLIGTAQVTEVLDENSPAPPAPQKQPPPAPAK